MTNRSVSSSTPATHYAALRIDVDASPEEIRAAYRAMAKQLHPDTSRSADTEKSFAIIARAYEVLSDPAKRRVYDESLRPATPRAHYTWSNIATHATDRPHAPDISELDELYDTFFGSRGEAPPRRA